ncbi:MAG: oligosaccharide flippase family protein [Candidatus Omnitrophota bacterium]
MSRKKIIKNAIKFSAGNYISNFLDFITGIIIRRILGPATMGIFMELMLLFEYGKNHNLGVLDALDREIPILNGKKDYARVKEISNVGFSFCMFSSLVFGVILILYSFFMHGMHESMIINGIRIIAFLNIVHAFISFYVVVIRTHHKFDLLTKYILIMGVVNLIFSTVLLLKFGFYGLLVALVLIGLARLAYLYSSSGYQFKLKIPFPLTEVKRLIKIGFPLLLSGFIFMLLRSVDRFMIIGFLDRTNLGYYSIATMMHGYVFQLPNLIYAVLFPNFYEAFGRMGNIQDIKNYYEYPTLAFAYLFPIFVGLAVLVLPLILHYILPKYLPGLLPAIILMLGTFFISVTNMSGYLLTALNKQKFIVIIGASVVLISVILNYSLLKIFNLGLTGVALATALTYFVYSLALIAAAFSNYTRILKEHLKFLFILYAPFVWTTSVLIIINLIFRNTFQNLKLDLICLLLQMLIFLTACLPLLFYLNKRTMIFDTVLQMVKEKSNLNAK